MRRAAGPRFYLSPERIHLYPILQGTQNKKEYAYNQSYARTSAVLADMGQTEKEIGESHEWALMFVAHINSLLNNIQWHLSLFKSVFSSIDIHL